MSHLHVHLTNYLKLRRAVTWQVKRQSQRRMAEHGRPKVRLETGTKAAALSMRGNSLSQTIRNGETERSGSCLVLVETGPKPADVSFNAAFGCSSAFGEPRDYSSLAAFPFKF
jgi:hypothetical protein